MYRIWNLRLFCSTARISSPWLPAKTTGVLQAPSLFRQYLLKMQPTTLCWRCAVTMGLQIGAIKVSVCETSPASSCIPALNSWISLWALDFASLIFAKFRVIVYSIESLPKRLVQKRLPSSDIFVAQIWSHFYPSRHRRAKSWIPGQFWICSFVVRYVIWFRWLTQRISIGFSWVFTFCLSIS